MDANVNQSPHIRYFQQACIHLCGLPLQREAERRNRLHLGGLGWLRSPSPVGAFVSYNNDKAKYFSFAFDYLMHCVLRTSARAVESWPCAAAYISGVRPLEIAIPLSTSLTEDNPSNQVTSRAFLVLTFTYCPRRWGQLRLQQAGPQQQLLPVQPDYASEQAQLVFLINISCTDHTSYNTWRISIVSPFSASCCSCLAAL